jgi:hypothetical protein
MTPTEHASRLITRYGSTTASQRVGVKVRSWATLAAFPCTGPTPLNRVRYWLAVDWNIHNNPNIPEVTQ